jgi:hypothetical protein
VPQVPQNFAAASFGAPQDGQPALSGAPHSRQKRRPAAFAVPHAAQFIAARSSARLGATPDLVG